MSLQPPGGGQEGGGGYSQPQDPWSGFEPGLASMPTDPIPQRQPEPYSGPTVPDAVWSGPTVLQGQAPPQFPYPPPPRRGNGGLIAGIVALILVLGGGGGYAAYHYIKTHQANGAQSPPATASGSTDTAPPAVFPYTAKEGDCVMNVGSEQKPKMAPTSCTTPNSYKIVKIARGSGIPLGPSGTFDTDTTSAAVCAGIEFDTWYGYQVDNPSLNLFFCMTDN